MEELEELKEDGDLFEDMAAVVLNDTEGDPDYSSLKRKSVMIDKESNEHIYATIEETDLKDNWKSKFNATSLILCCQKITHPLMKNGQLFVFSLL